VIVKVSGLYNLQCGKFDVKNIIVVRTNRLRKEALINMTKGHKIIQFEGESLKESSILKNKLAVVQEDLNIP